MRRLDFTSQTAQCAFLHLPLDYGTAAVSENIEVEFARENPSFWGKLAITIVVRWIKTAVKQGFATDQQARELLGMTGRLLAST